MEQKTEHRKPKRSQASLRLPEGLNVLACTIRLPIKDLDFTGLIADLGGVPTAYKRSDGGGIRVILSGAGVLAVGHGHLEIERTKSKEEYTIGLEMVAGSHARASKGLLPLVESFQRVASFMAHPGSSFRILVGANFTFDLKAWDPTVPLPFSPSAITDQIPGLPKIAGLDFTFGEKDESQQLLRAFVTTYDGINRMILRLLLSCTGTWSTDLTRRVVELTNSHLPIFVRKKRREA